MMAGCKSVGKDDTVFIDKDGKKYICISQGGEHICKLKKD